MGPELSIDAVGPIWLLNPQAFGTVGFVRSVWRYQAASRCPFRIHATQQHFMFFLGKNEEA